LAARTFDALSGRVAAAGEPFQLFFTPQTMESELRRAGFQRSSNWIPEQLNELYFKERADGLKLSPVKLGMLTTRLGDDESNRQTGALCTPTHFAKCAKWMGHGVGIGPPGQAGCALR